MITIKHLSVTARRFWLSVLALAAFALRSSQAATLWTGPNLNFAQTPATPADVVLAGKVVLTRNGNNALYNTAAGETSAGPSSPLDTEWAFGALADYATLSYQSLESMRNGDLAAVILNKLMVVHLINEDIYLSVEFTDWGQHFAGGFAYTRSTPAQGTPPPATPSVTWANPTSIPYGTALSSAQLNATASVPGSFAYTPANGAVLNAGAYTLSVIFTPTDTVDYTNATASVSLTVLPAPLTVTAANASKTYGTALSFGPGSTAFTATGLQNSETVGSVTLACTGGAATAAVGSYAITPSAATGGTFNAGNYTIAYVNGTLTVSPAVPLVTWTNPVVPIIYGAALTSSQLNAAASVPGSFAYTPANGTVLNAGAYALSVIFTPTDTVDYSAATGSVSLAVLPAPLTVTAANASRPYGQPNPVFTGSITGVTNGDNITATYSCSATATGPAGSYPIIPSLLDPSNRQTNYTVSLLNGSLTVLPATPSITWSNPAAIIYGTALTSVQLNAAASVPGTFAYTPANGTVLNAGAYALSVIFTPTDTVDYSAATGSVSLVVLPAPLAVTAANASRAYGQPNPVFTGAITGVTNGDNITATYSCSATATSPAGTYPIIPSLLNPSNRQTNYTVSLLNGILTVTLAAPPTIVSVTPNTGLTNGGTPVTLLGTGFATGATVNFGALPAGSVTVINSTNLTAVTPPSALGTVNVVVTNADGQSGTLTNAFTYAAPPGTPPSIVSQPANQVLGLGQMALFTATATGTAPLSYQWQLSGVNLADNGRITGSQSNLLTLTGVLLTDAGDYQVLVTNAYGSATSAVASLAIVAPPLFLAPTRTDGAIALAWSATPGQTYQVQYTTNLTQPDWTNLLIVTATNSTATASDALSSSVQRFYRTVWLP